MLDDLELPLVQQLDAVERQERAQHAVPALEGDFLQALGRRANSFTLEGVIANEDGSVAEQLKKLREKFRAAAPVDFVTDIAIATRVDSVLIEEMSVRELAGKPERFEYAFALREFVPAPAPEVEPPPPQPPPLTTSLIVEVIVEGQPGFDFSKVIVTVEGHKEDGSQHNTTLTNRTNNIWTEDDFPPGNYTAKAVVTDPPMSNSVTANVLEGQKTKVTIVLRPGSVGAVGTAYVVHYWFDKAFIEPCLRPVLREVAQRAINGNEKLLIVGHTDLVGGDDYNQALSERRARGVYAYLTYGSHPDASVAEWNELRKTRTVGQTTSLNDTWGVREYQYMLQDLGWYVGPINEENDENTQNAVRAFQGNKGLAVDGIVGDDTWQALIRDYLAQDHLSVSDSAFLRNARGNCDGGPLLWLGCGEKDPVRNTQNAWRPNRRTEMLFVNASRIPPDNNVPQPVTYTIRPDGSTPGAWCLNTGSITKPCGFLTRQAEESDKFLVQPAHPERILANGQILFDDGTPYANQRFALIAPDGEYLHTDASGNADDKGERPSGPKRGRSSYLLTDDQGRFSHPTPTPVGIYILELPDVIAPQVARENDDPPSAARGNIVCLEYAPGVSAPGTNGARAAGGTSPAQGAVVQARAVPAAPVNPTITLAAPAVVVKKSYTNPARDRVTLKTNVAFNRTGTLTRSGNTGAIKLFTAANGGAEITFDGTDNVFTGAQLTTGVNLFAESVAPSAIANDYQLTLMLAAGPTAVGPPANVTLTAVGLTLNIFASRTATGVDPNPMPQPPSPPPAAGATPTDKWFGGRFVHVQDAGNHHGRAMIEVTMQPAGAAGFSGNLALRAVRVAGNTVGAVDNKVQLFDTENVTPGEAAHPFSFQFNTSTLTLNGAIGTIRFFAQGRTVSGALRDTGFQLGLELRPGTIENDGDRVRLTVVQFSHLVADVPSTSANTARVHPPAPANVVNSPVPRHNFDITNFAEDFALASTLVLVEDSVLAADPINLSVRVAPAGVPVSWVVQRDTTPHTGDAAAIVNLIPARNGPTLNLVAGNILRRTMLADHVGSFFIRPFVDCNGNNDYDFRIDREPYIVMNLVLVRAQGVSNTSLANPPGTITTLRAGTLNTVPVSALATTTGFDLTTGNVPAAPGGNTFANPVVAAAHNDATIRVIGGGPTGQRGLNRLMTGWIQSELPVATSLTVPHGEDVVAEYDDIAPPPPVRTHRRTSIWETPGGTNVFLPGGPAPTLLPGPFLDVSAIGVAGTGGNTAVGTEGAIGPPVVPPGPGGPGPQPGVTKTPVAAPGVGEQWRVHMWDSPGDVVLAAHGGFPGTLLRYRFNLDFRTDLCLWTNVTGVPGATPNAACRLYSSVQSNSWIIRFSIHVALAPPARPTLTATPGGPLIARTYFIRVTYVNAAGETIASAENHVAIAAGRRLTVNSPPALAGATGYNVYAGTTAGSGTLQNSAAIAIGTRFTEPATGLVAGTAPPAADTSGGLVAPGAPGVGSTTTTATTFFVRATYVNPRGETTVSTEAHLAVPAGRLLVVNAPRAFGDATGYNVYIGTAAGTGTKQNAAAIAIGTNFTMPATGLIAGTAPPAANTTGGPPITNSVTLNRDPLPTRLATPVQGSGLEVRGPAGLRVLATDART